MSFRNRPVLNRKHRPRWQDELRTQQLVVAGFAAAIALALGIYGATVWSGFWEAHLRPVAAIGQTTFTTADVAGRERMIQAEVSAQAAELQLQLTGGPRDQLIEQQIQSLGQSLSEVSSQATSSLVDGEVLGQRAAEYGVSVTDEEIDAEIAERATLPERVALQLIAVHALPDDAAPDAEPTDEQREAARAEAEEVLQRHQDGEGFGALAAEVSDDFTASLDGQLGWIEDGDGMYDEFFEAARDLEVEEVAGPIETEQGWALVRLVDRREATRDELLSRLLGHDGLAGGAYRAYVRDELLVAAFREYFTGEVLGGEQPQRRVAQIVIEPVEVTAVPQERARHVLIQPDPALGSDQASATEEQWDAALAEAEEVRELLSAPDADWFAIAEEYSDDTGSGAGGGDLGWYDPASSPFVEEFAVALEELDLLELSGPVRTDFGYHIIQKTGARTSPQSLAVELVDQLRADPDAFADVAERLSDDRATAAEGGEVGWIVRYQLDQTREDVIFGLTEPGEISDPLDLGEEGTVIYKLLEVDDSRQIEEERLDQISTDGFDRWLDQEVRAPVTVWVDPQFASTATAS